MTLTELRTTLAAFTARLQPLRRSRSGTALYFDSKAALTAHKMIKETCAAIRNAREGDNTMPSWGFDKWAPKCVEAIEKKLMEAGV